MKEYEYRKEIYELRKRNYELESKNNQLENTINQIFNSKGWKILEKGKKLKEICNFGKKEPNIETENTKDATLYYDYKTEPAYESEYQEDIDFSNTEVYIKTLAFYLPQFHEIPENDKWWGKGFTEWTNTKKSEPRFEGHYMPRVPHQDFGYYSLDDISTIKKQVELAKKHKIYGFVFYYYWFSGKRLLEKPLDLLLEHKEIDFPFALCWANENWTRTWDGLEKEVLIEQRYMSEDPQNFIKDLKKYVTDDRYIRIEDKPLIMVYNPSAIPNFKEMCSLWRKTAREVGIGEIVIWSKTEIGNPSYINTDFVDGEFDFAPHGFYLPNDQITGIKAASNIVNYSKLVNNLSDTYKNHYPLKLFSYSVTMGWDNAARRKNGFKIYYHYSLEAFYSWLIIAINKIQENGFSNSFLLINAWNEWGEGTYLEPDQKYGYANINTLSRAICKIPLKANFKVLTKNQQNLKIAPKIAVQAHVFYLDLLEELLGQLAYIPVMYDLYISTDTIEKQKEIIKWCEKRKIKNYRVDVFPNRGRDILPLLKQMKKRINDYEYLLHVHTKKSLTNEFGNDWREYLWYNLLGSTENINNIFNEFSENHHIGVIYPIVYEKAFDMLVNSGGIINNNKVDLEILCDKLSIPKSKLTQNITFPASSMFWAKTDALKGLFDTLEENDFEEEKGQEDSTMAYAVERIIDLLAEKNGYKSLQILNKTKIEKKQQ